MFSPGDLQPSHIRDVGQHNWKWKEREKKRTSNLRNPSVIHLLTPVASLFAHRVPLFRMLSWYTHRLFCLLFFFLLTLFLGKCPQGDQTELPKWVSHKQLQILTEGSIMPKNQLKFGHVVSIQVHYLLSFILWNSPCTLSRMLVILREG